MATAIKGISFPFRFNSGGSVAMTELTPDDFTLIRESLYQLWFTRKGERIMESEYGNGASFNFEAMDDITEQGILRHEMMKAAEELQDLLTINDITFEPHPEIETALIVNVDCTVNKFFQNATIQIVYQPITS